jgi:hypothetical protein
LVVALYQMHYDLLQGNPSPPPGYERARAICRMCVLPRRFRLNALLPRWGGSQAAVHALVEETRRLGRDEPRLSGLYGFEERRKCDDLLPNEPSRPFGKQAATPKR